LIPEEASKLIGKADPPGIFEVEKGAIKKYADAIGDRNPLFWDEEFARSTRYGSLIAPPGYFGWPTKWTEPMPLISPGGMMDVLTAIMTKDGHPFILDGGGEVEYKSPIRPGDVIAASNKLLDIREKETQGAKMYFCVFENIFLNQNGALVMKELHTIIFR
jgi:acyl dehydratase